MTEALSSVTTLAAADVATAGGPLTAASANTAAIAANQASAAAAAGNITGAAHAAAVSVAAVGHAAPCFDAGPSWVQCSCKGDLENPAAAHSC